MLFTKYFVSLTKISEMTLPEIESKLEAIQLEQGLNYLTLKKAGLGYMLVKNIQHGKDYQIKYLFKYIDLLCYYIKVDGQMIDDLPALGQHLRRRRMEMNITPTQMAGRMEVSYNTFKRFENGLGCRRDTLLRYVSVLGDVDFSICDILSNI